MKTEQFLLSDFGGCFLTSAPVQVGDKAYPGTGAYVEWFIPANARETSVTFVHGGGGQSSEFLRTPDNRQGWVHAFLRAGFPVYLLDRPGHGRCHWNQDVLGPCSSPPDYDMLYPRFVEPDRHMLWPEASKHNRWSAAPEAGDRFMASQGVMATSLEAAQAHVEAIASSLFDLTGPTVILSHSAGGPCGWALSACGAALVKAIVAVEPLGFPDMEHATGRFSHGLVAKQFAGSADPYDRPIAMITGEATWMREANIKAAQYLSDQGCEIEHFLLEEHGIFGNGHMMMSETNSDEIAALIIGWLRHNV